MPFRNSLAHWYTPTPRAPTHDHVGDTHHPRRPNHPSEAARSDEGGASNHCWRPGLIIEDWRRDYNANGPHSAHGELVGEFALQWTTTHHPKSRQKRVNLRCVRPVRAQQERLTSANAVTLCDFGYRRQPSQKRIGLEAVPLRVGVTPKDLPTCLCSHGRTIAPDKPADTATREPNATTVKWLETEVANPHRDTCHPVPKGGKRGLHLHEHRAVNAKQRGACGLRAP